MNERQKHVIRTLTNSISRTKRKLEKARKFYYPNIKILEIELNDKKERLKLYKHQIKNINHE